MNGKHFTSDIRPLQSVELTHFQLDGVVTVTQTLVTPGVRLAAQHEDDILKTNSNHSHKYFVKLRNVSYIRTIHSCNGV